MTKFTIASSIEYEISAGDILPARIVAIVPDADKPYVVEIIKKGGTKELVLLHPNGTCDNDGCAPRIRLAPVFADSFLSVFPDGTVGSGHAYIPKVRGKATVNGPLGRCAVLKISVNEDNPKDVRTELLFPDEEPEDSSLAL